MKMFKYIFFAGAVCTAAFLAGCNEDEYTLGEASSENGLNVYFESPTGAEVVLGPETTEFTITVGRNQADEALSIPLKVDNPHADLIDIPTQVDFAQGESSKSITVKVSSGLKMFETYPVRLSIDAQYTQAYLQSEVYPRLSLQVIKEDYVPYADGKFSDYLTSPDENPMETDQVMEYSAILDMYRLKSCWGTGTGSIVFSWDGENKVSLESPSIPTGYTIPEYGSFTASLVEDATYDQTSKTFTFPLEFIAGDVTTGACDETYTITSLK